MCTKHPQSSAAAFAPGSLAATLGLIVIAASIALTVERRKLALARRASRQTVETNRMRAVVLAGLGALLNVGPSWAEEVSSPISPDSYRALSCTQIVQEARAVSRKGFVLSGLQPGTGGTDITETKSAVILVWPASTNTSADKMANLRYVESQIAALEQASVASQCSIQFQRPGKIAQ